MGAVLIDLMGWLALVLTLAFVASSLALLVAEDRLTGDRHRPSRADVVHIDAGSDPTPVIVHPGEGSHPAVA